MRTVCIFLLILGKTLTLTPQVSYFKTYSIDEGLSHSQANSLFQDSKGYIWITTFGGGISRFDGNQFLNFGEKEGLTSNITRGGIEDRQGRIWFGSLGGGIYIYDGKKMIPWYDSILPKTKRIYSLTLDKAGNTWFATDSGVFMYDGKATRHFGKAEGMDEQPYMHIQCDKDGNIWMSGWDAGLKVYHKGKFLSLHRSGGLSADTVMHTCTTPEGVTYAATSSGISEIQLKDGRLTGQKINVASWCDHSFINAVLYQPGKGLWIAANPGGLGLLSDDHKISRITAANGLPGMNVYSLMLDREKNLWMSVWGFGITRYSGGALLHYGKESGLEGSLINNVIRIPNAKLFLGTTDGVFSYNEDSAKFFRENEFPDRSCRVLLRPDSGISILYGSRLVEKFPSGQKTWDKENGLNAGILKHGLSDAEGNYWFATWGKGAGKFKDGKCESFMPDNGFCCDYLNAIYVDKKQNKWFGTWDHGLCGIMRDGKIRNIRKAQGLPNEYVNCITEDESGRLWIGTYGGGVAVQDGTGFIVINAGDGLVNETVSFIVISGDHAWIGTAKGLSHIRVGSVKKGQRPEIKNFGKAEGMQNVECLGNSGFADKNGRIWFATKKALVSIDPDKIHENPLETTPFITGLKLFFEERAWDSLGFQMGENSILPENPEFTHDQNHLTFEFTGICMTAPEKVLYRYMLEGAETAWSPEMQTGKVTYSGLKPGHYTFKVIACNNEGRWTSEPVTYSFTISPPFYQSLWFYLLCISLLAGGGWSFFAVRTRKLQNDKRILEEKVKERTREVVKQKEIIEEKNKDITDSINYAARIQEAILPAKEEKYRLFPDAFIFLQPRDIVSGDFYWFTEKDGQRFIAAVDCTGHGVPGAFMSMIGNAFLNQIVNERGITEPGVILDELREMVIKALKQTGAEGENRDGMDMALLCFDDSSKQAYFAGANNPAWIIRNADKGLEEIKGDKKPIGMYKGDAGSFTTHALNLKAGDLIYIFTDGYADQFGGVSGEGGKKFKYRRLKELLLKHCELSMSEQEQMLADNLREWMGELEQVDDICVIGIRIQG